MAKTKLTVKEIKAFLEREGFQEVTEEDKKASWYKLAIKQPSCYKNESLTRRHRLKKVAAEKKPRVKVSLKKAVE